MQTEAVLKKVAQAIVDKKGFNLTDYFLVAEGNVERHVQGLARVVEELLKEEGMAPACVEGFAEGHWIVIDCWEVMIHLFTPPYRKKYALERVWERGKLMDLGVG